MFSEGNAARPIRCDSSLQIVMAVWRAFLNLNLLGRVWQTTADNKGCLVHFQFLKSAPNGLLYLQWAVTFDQIIQQNNLQRKEPPCAVSLASIH